MHRGKRKRGEKERKNQRREKARACAYVCMRERKRELVGGHAFAALPTDRVCMRACIHACKSGRVSARFVMQCNVFSRLARPHLPAFVFANTVSDINIVRRCA